MTRPNGLGEYLRARRELVDPADAGLSVTGVRRTPGLRREEVATLAGISADHYLRLEQIGGPGGQLLVIYHAEPGSETASSLGLLGSLTAEARPEPRRRRAEEGSDGQLRQHP